MEYIKIAAGFKPAASEAVDVLIKDYGPEIGKLAEVVRNHMVVSTDTTITQYIKLGYTRQEAILLTLNSKLALEEAFKNAGNKGSK